MSRPRQGMGLWILTKGGGADLIFVEEAIFQPVYGIGDNQVSWGIWVVTDW